MFTAEHLAAFAGTAVNDNMRSAVAGLAKAGRKVGLHRPHRLAHFLSQTSHESNGWRYDREIWGPTAAQKRYDTRTDLGNTPQIDGDGFLYRGRTPMQITGKYNTGRFSAWAKKVDPKAPDFLKNPDMMNTDPWEGLGPIWYWAEGNPTGKSLNVLADANDIEAVTKRINGGLNGFTDRKSRYTSIALIMLGYSPREIARFQKDHGLVADGIAGSKTRAALHAALTKLPDVTFEGQTATITAPATNSPALAGGVIAAIVALVAAYLGLK